jgi:hypothetical protein
MLRRNIAVAVALAVAAAVACSESTPPPEPRRSPSPRIPSCVTDADCSAGEECRDGVCARPGLDEVTEGTPRGACPEGCAPGEVCADGICVGQITGDAGGATDDSCGGCPEGWTCEVITGLCQPPGDGPTGEDRRREEPPR